MPTITHLFNQHMQAAHVREPRAGENGSVETVDMYELIFIDRQNGNQVRVKFEREARDDLIRQLSAGISIASAIPPKLT